MTASQITIVGSVTSPFVRAVRIACEELGLPYEIELTSFFAKNSPEQEARIKQHNPLMRVPVLVDGAETIIDSRIIITYLIKQYGGKKEFAKSLPQTVQQENILTVINGILEAGIGRFILKNTQPNINIEEGYAARSLVRVHSGLTWLDENMARGQHFGVSESLLICAFDWLKKRGITDSSMYQNLNAIYQQFQTRDSVRNTQIPENV